MINNSLKKNLKIIVPILFISASFLGIMRDIVLVLLQPLLHHASGFILGLRKGLYISVQLLFTLAYIGHIFQSRLLSTTRSVYAKVTILLVVLNFLLKMIILFFLNHILLYTLDLLFILVSIALILLFVWEHHLTQNEMNQRSLVMLIIAVALPLLFFYHVEVLIEGILNRLYQGKRVLQWSSFYQFLMFISYLCFIAYSVIRLVMNGSDPDQVMQKNE